MEKHSSAIPRGEQKTPSLQYRETCTVEPHPCYNEWRAAIASRKKTTF